MHSSITFSVQGFGTTINIINGGLECNKPNGKESPQAKNRIAYYKKFAWLEMLSVVLFVILSLPGTFMLILKMRSLAASTKNSSQREVQEPCLYIGTRYIFLPFHFYILANCDKLHIYSCLFLPYVIYSCLCIGTRYIFIL